MVLKWHRNEHYVNKARCPFKPSGAVLASKAAEADTTYGKLGVKVWVNKGEILTGREDVLAVAAEDDAKAKKARHAEKLLLTGQKTKREANAYVNA